MNGAWECLIFALLIIAARIISWPGEGHFWGFSIPVFGERILLIIGLFIAFLSIRAILRGEGKPKKIEYSDQDVAKAKTVLDRQYFKKYGKLPEYPLEAQEVEAQGPEADATTPERKV